MYNKQAKELADSTIIVCGIVRNCGKNLRRNIKTVDKLCSLAKGYHVVIYENDSVDDTKVILKKWADTQENIHISLNNFNTNTIPPKQTSVNPAFSVHRIEKMALYRNFYLDYIEKENLPGDYVVIVDLDVYNINFDGILNSFQADCTWDAIAANGTSYAPSALFRKRHYDTYALIECGRESIPQTESDIKKAQYKWAFLKKGMPLIRVASAFGGLAIYRREAIAQCRYGVLLNNDANVECLSEHVHLYKQMSERGYSKIYVNPSMKVRYQTKILETIKRIF